MRPIALRSLVFIVLMSGVVLPQDQTPPPIQEFVVYGCPIHAEVQSKVPGKCHKCNTTLLAVKPGGEQGFYTCPMHPEVQSAKSGSCPKCKMTLVKAAPPETGEYIVRMDTSPRAVKAGEKVTLRFSIFHPAKEEQVKEFGILHDMPFHLFIVSQDLEHFDHIHPTKQSDGSFVIDTVLPRPGYYKIFCDYFPVGGSPQVTQLSLVTSGFPGDLISSLSRLEPDQSLTKTLEGTRFEMRFGPEKPFAGREAQLHYKLIDVKTGDPIKDLRPYLGAWGHTLILSEDGTDYLHSHPTEMIPEDTDRSKLTGGSEVVFDTFFPHPGNYRIWSQFLRGEKLITVSFTVNIPRLQ